jgi:aconitate hydratase
MLMPPPPPDEEVELQKGPNIKSLPDIEPVLEQYELPVDLKMGDNISTDEILKAGAEALPFRSNIPKISEFAFEVVDSEFHDRALRSKQNCGGHVVVAGENYAQGSSREHAALAVKYLGQVAVLAKSYARIGWQNLVNFGIIPLEFENNDDYEHVAKGDVLVINNVKTALINGQPVEIYNKTKDKKFTVAHAMSKRQLDILLAGGVINHFKNSEKINS